MQRLAIHRHGLLDGLVRGQGSSSGPHPAKDYRQPRQRLRHRDRRQEALLSVTALALGGKRKGKKQDERWSESA